MINRRQYQLVLQKDKDFSTQNICSTVYRAVSQDIHINNFLGVKIIGLSEHPKKIYKWLPATNTTAQVDLLESEIFGELIDNNHCWRHFH